MWMFGVVLSACTTDVSGPSVPPAFDASGLWMSEDGHRSLKLCASGPGNWELIGVWTSTLDDTCFPAGYGTPSMRNGSIEGGAISLFLSDPNPTERIDLTLEPSEPFPPPHGQLLIGRWRVLQELDSTDLRFLYHVSAQPRSIRAHEDSRARQNTRLVFRPDRGISGVRGGAGQ